MTSIWIDRPPLSAAREQGKRDALEPRAIETDALQLRIAPRQRLFALRAKCSEAKVRSAFAQSFGAVPPEQPNGVAFGRPTICWLGPNYWMMLFDDDGRNTDCASLAAALMGETHILADITDSCAIFDLDGVRAREILAGLCTLDFEGEALSEGRCARTRLVRIPLTILRMHGDNAFRLIVDRSFCDYARDFLFDAAHTALGGASAR